MDVLTLAELQQLCRCRGLAATGSKEELMELLMRSAKSKATNEKGRCKRSAPATTVRTPKEASATQCLKQYDTMTIPQLKDLCRRRSLPVGGIKVDIVARLKAGDLRETGVSPPGTGAIVGVEQCASERRKKGRRTVMPVLNAAKLQSAKARQDANDKQPKKAAKRKLELSSPDASTSVVPVARSADASPSKLLSQLVTKETIHRPATTVLRGGDTPNVKAAVGKKRKILEQAKTRTTPADASPIPNKSRKSSALGGPSPQRKKMKQLTLVQCIAAQPPATIAASEAVSSTHRTNVYLVYCIEPPWSCGVVAVLSTCERANARVRQEFYEMHPDGWSVEDIARHTRAVDVKYTDKLLTMSMLPPHKTWTVGAVPVPASSADVAAMRECYVVCSRQSQAGKEPAFKCEHIFSTKEAANVYMNMVFYDKNPWNWTKEQFAKGKPVQGRLNDGMESLKKEGSDGIVWDIVVMPVKGGEAPSTQVSSIHEASACKPSLSVLKAREAPPQPPAKAPPSHEQSAGQPVVHEPSSQKLFVVYTSHIFRQERRGRRKESQYEFYPPVKTEKEANALVEAVFYKLNPWEWTTNQFDGKPVEKTHVHGNLKISVSNTDTWEVGVAPVCRSAYATEGDPAAVILVYTVHGNEMSTLRKPPDPKVQIETVLSPHEVTGSRFEELFCKYNPYRWGRQQFQDEHSKVMKTFEDGLFTVSVTPTSDASWSMKCTPFTHKTVPELSLEAAESSSRIAPRIVVKAEPAASRLADSADWFLVFSTNRRCWDAPNYDFFPIVRTKEEANALVHHVFTKENPWGGEKDELNRLVRKAKRSERKGLLSLSIWENEEKWAVQAVRVAGGPHLSPDLDPGAVVVIHSAFGFTPDGFHAPREQSFKIQAVAATKDAANAMMEKIFLKKHGYDWSIESMLDGSVGSGACVKKEMRCGLLRMSIDPDDSESWSVEAQGVAAMGRTEKGGFIIYESEGEEEDDDDPW